MWDCKYGLLNNLMELQSVTATFESQKPLQEQEPLVQMHPQTDPDHSIVSVEFYGKSDAKLGLFIVLCILTGGLLALFSMWILKLRISLLYVKANESEATLLLIKTPYTEELVDVVLTEKGVRRFYFRFMPFEFSDSKIVPIFFNTSVPYNRLNSMGSLSEEDVNDLRNNYGACRIDVPIKSIPVLLVQEVLHPFFVFQLFSVILWFSDGYVYYASAITLLSIISVTTNLVTTRVTMRKIANMVHSQGTVKVLRGEGIPELEEIDQAELVPGDIMVIDRFRTMPCDAIVIRGSCVMEEGMLTGESVPVLKDSLPNIDRIYDIEKDKRFSLYEGTKIIVSRGVSEDDYGAHALVVRTGYQTLKGKLVRTILFPKPTKFKFYRDSMLFILVLGIVSIIGFVVIIPSFVSQGFDGGYIVKRSLDLITITIPPALPTAMAAGISFALLRLSKQKIFCIAPNRINAAGKISAMIFDKTGTLTEDGMDLIGVLQGEFDQLEPKPSGKILINMATCHSLTSISGTVMGDTQDLRIFESTNAAYIEVEQADNVLARIQLQTLNSPGDQTLDSPRPQADLEILHIFHFTSELKRMGVVINNAEHYELHLKGAPEVIKPLCRPDSVPIDFDESLGIYTQKGFRVLACAYKTIRLKGEVKDLNFSEIEHNLKFLGFIVLENKLKPETIPSLDVLREAGIIIKMATGDNVLTGVAVGKECKLVPDDVDLYVCELDNGRHKITAYLHEDKNFDAKPVYEYTPWGHRETYTLDDGEKLPTFYLAATGEFLAKAVDDGDTKLVDDLVFNGAIFARMAPEHKSLLIEQLQFRNKLVGMCGDGANDCGALKTADIGISLCEAEASIAAPFTSSIPNISCIPIVLREGRCSLAISLQEFKFMALYSMCQFNSVLILYWYGINLTDIQFLIEDLFIILPLAVVIGYTGPRKELSKVRPVGSLISVSVLTSVIGQTTLIALTQGISMEMVKAQSFYHEVDTDDTDDDAALSEAFYKWENSAVYIPGLFQLLALCYFLSISKPFKQPPYTNIALTVWLLFWTGIILWLMIWPIDLLRWIFVVKPFPGYFRGYMLALCFSYLIVAYSFERFCVPWLHLTHKNWRRDKEYKALKA